MEQGVKSLKLLLRFLTVGGLVLVLLVPLLMVRGLIADRETYQAKAVDRISQSMAGPQQVVGPLRVVPWQEQRSTTVVGEDGRPTTRQDTVQGYALQTPLSLSASGDLKPNLRRIGVYEVRTFEWTANMAAEFAPLPLAPVAGRTYGQPYLVLGLADVRGLVGTPALNLDGRPLLLESGTGVLGERMSGVHAKLPMTGVAADGVRLPASKLQLRFVLAGTESLGIAPIGDSNHIQLQSSWPHPLFGGRYSPHDSKISDNGFSARWEISSLASGSQAQLGEKGTGHLTRRMRLSEAGGYEAAGEDSRLSAIDSLDVHLVDPVDTYTQVDRASKYGILFVVLTFVAFGLFELIKRLKIHPLQYLLVGLALAIFFLLLLSLSEHIEFWKAYLISAAACIGLQFFYLSGVLQGWWRAAGFAAMLTALYGVLYALLLSDDNALLMGSLLLFGILATIMWVTRKVNWYELGNELR